MEGRALLVDPDDVRRAMHGRSALREQIASAIVERCDESHLVTPYQELLDGPSGWNLFRFDGFLVELAVATMLTGDPRYVEHALGFREVIGEVWETIPQDRDLFRPYVLMSLATFAELLPDDAHDEKAAARGLAADMAAHIWSDIDERDYGDPQRTPWNHAIIVSAALGVAGLACAEHPDRDAWLRHGIDRTRRFFETGVSREGLTYEGLHYCGYVFRMIGPVLSGARRHGLIDRLTPPGTDLDQRLHRIPAWYARSVWPRGRWLDNHNDSLANPHSPMYGFLRSFASLEPELCALVWDRLLGENGTGTFGVQLNMSSLVDSLFHVPDVPPDPTVLERFDLDLVCEEVGLVSTRDRWGADATVLTFTTGHAPCELHGQSDKGSITLVMRGSPTLFDTGAGNRRAEGSPSSSVAHNLVLIDGRGQCPAGQGTTVEGDLTAIHRDPLHLALSSDATAAYCQDGYNEVRHAHRHLVFVRAPVPYVVMLDDLEKDGHEHRYELLLHVSSNTVGSVPEHGDRFEVGGYGIAPQRPVLATRLLIPGAVDIAIDQFEAHRGPPGAHPYLRLASSAVRGRFLVVFSPADEVPDEAAVTEDAGAIEVVLRWPHGTDTFRFTPATHGPPTTAPAFRREAPT